MQYGARPCIHFFRTDQASPLRFDLAGSGLSPPDPTDDYTDARRMQLLKRLMDKFGVTRGALVGNSVGGRIARSFAAHFMERVDKLVLMSPDPFRGDT